MDVPQRMAPTQVSDTLLTAEDLAYLTPQERQELGLIAQPNALWRPLPGPQTAAYLSDADELFYGGSAGGGKTDLVLGLAFTQHRNTIIYRREYPQLRGIVERGNELIGDKASYNSQDHIWRFKDGRVVELGAVQFVDDVTKYQGRPHSLCAFDEISNFVEQQYRFLIGWNRSSRQGERVRVVATGNPPTGPEGEWVIKYWAPWLDPSHLHPAKPGELRWFAVIAGKDIERPDGQPFYQDGELIQPRSRTFIPARLSDNPYLAATGYGAVLQGLPEPLRSQLLYGDFTITQQDNPWQVIPTQWVRDSMRRWKALEDAAREEAASRGEHIEAGKQYYRPTIENLQQVPATPTRRAQTIITGKPMPLSALGVDPARGGDDQFIIAPRYGAWFDKPMVFSGKEMFSAPRAVAQLLDYVKDGGVCNIDGIGIGAAVVDLMRGYIGDRANAIIFSQGSDQRDKTNTFGFRNMRAQAYWQLREQLDPQAENPLALPPDDELLIDLTAPQYSMQVTGVQIESKDEIRKRIGRSPDKGDAVVLASMLGRREMHLYNYTLY